MNDDVPAPGASMPWSLSTARTAFLCTMAGLVLLVWAWWASSGTANLDRQTTWGAVGIVAVALVGMGNVFWLISGRRAVRRRCGDLVDRIERAGIGTAASVATDAPTTAPLVTVRGSGRYHRDTCLLVLGKDVRPVPARGRTRDRLRPCEMCEP